MRRIHQQIAILDFGSQYTHLIARRLRNLGILAKLYPADINLNEIDNLIGIVLSGSPAGVGDDKYQVNENLFKLNIPILGLCYGHQLIAHYFGGRVAKHEDQSEYGLAKLNVGESILFNNLEPVEEIWMSHGDSVIETPEGFKVIAGQRVALLRLCHQMKRKYILFNFTQKLHIHLMVWR